jgi:microcystin degradation protein MlrC
MVHPARPLRIAVLMFQHETVTFLPNDTTREDFIYAGSPAGGEALLGSAPASYIGGFVKVAREHAGVELVGIESPLFPKTGTGSGWITTDAFEHFVGRMITGLRAEGPFDGAYLSLHGAAAVRGVARPEAEIARRVRAELGPSARIAATMDPHANEDAAFLEQADLCFCVKYFPHYDERLQGERAARTLIRALRGDYSPVNVTVKVPILTPTVMQWTGAAPWSQLVDRALTWEARRADLHVNVMFSFPWADVPDVGMTVQATTNGDEALARAVAADVAAFAWARRSELARAAEVLTVAEGVTRARAAVAAGASPVVLADHSDRSGAATWVLAELIARDAPRALIATIADAETIAQLLARGAQPGDPVDIAVGGRLDPSAGLPSRIVGRVHAIHRNIDPFAIQGAARKGATTTWISLAFGTGSMVVLSPNLAQIIEPAGLAALGLDPAGFDVIALKSRVHFRRGFADTGFAPTVLVVEPDEPFLGTTRLDALPYRHVDIARFYPFGDPAFDPTAGIVARQG